MFYIMRLTPAIISALLPAIACAEKIDFNTQIQPILSENCYACHGPDGETVEAGLRLDSEKDALKGGESGKAIVPGDPGKSLIIERITHSDPDEVMPPPKKKDRLKPAQVALIRQWIEEGAKWGTHWAFVAPQRPSVPAVKDAAWVKNPIDSFVLAKLEEQGLAPSAEAEPATLLRRISLDLTGLPPTPEELSAPFDYGKETARLISSPHLASAGRGSGWMPPDTPIPPAMRRISPATTISTATGSSGPLTRTRPMTSSS